MELVAVGYMNGCGVFGCYVVSAHSGLSCFGLPLEWLDFVNININSRCECAHVWAWLANG